MGAIIFFTWHTLKTGHNVAYQEIAVARGNVVRQIAASGPVKPAQNVDLSWQVGGKIIQTNVNVGDSVSAGQVLAALDSAELANQLAQAQANIESAQASLDQLVAVQDAANQKLTELQNGARPQQIELQQNAVSQANLSLNNLYSNSLVTINDAYTKAQDAVNNQTKAVYTNFNDIYSKLSFLTNNQQLEIDLGNQKMIVKDDLNSWQKEMAALPPSSDNTSIDAELANAQKYLGDIEKYLSLVFDTVNASVNLSQTSENGLKSAVTGARAENSAALSEINGQIQAISAAKIAADSAQKQLDLLLAGAQAEDIAAQQATVRSAAASVEAQQARIDQARAQADAIRIQLGKNSLISPISGVITRQDAKIGQIATPGQAVISVNSDTKNEIEIRLSETDVADIKVGDEARVTVDAYGDSQKFGAKIIAIDPAATADGAIMDYKVRLQFDENYSAIKAGMTANAEIAAQEKDNVLLLPQNVLIRKNDLYFVILPDLSQKQVQVGLLGMDGNAEIISGLSPGDKVISYGK